LKYQAIPSRRTHCNIIQLIVCTLQIGGGDLMRHATVIWR